MGKNHKTEFLELYNKLPESVQDFLASDEMGVIIDDALNLGKVPSEKFSSVMDIITEVLFLQLPKEKFRNKLEKRINISPVSAQIIDKVIETKIFKMFEKELSQYKPQPLKQRAPTEPLGSPKIKSVTKENAKQTITKKTSSDQIIPEYSSPDPSKVIVEKPVNKTEKLKKVVTPKVSAEQQEKIREKLLAAMQKKDAQPKIVREMKKVFLKSPMQKETKKGKKETSVKKKIRKLKSSKILSGEGKKFEDEETFVKTQKEKPYILDVKLKKESSAAKVREDKQKKKKVSQEKPIPYKKYQKKNPFGQA